MPVGQRLAGGAQPVGAGRGQPVQLVELVRGSAGRNRRRAACDAYSRCTAVAAVEQLAGDVGGIELARSPHPPACAGSSGRSRRTGLPTRPRSRLARGFSQKGFRSFIGGVAMGAHERREQEQTRVTWVDDSIDDGALADWRWPCAAAPLAAQIVASDGEAFITAHEARATAARRSSWSRSRGSTRRQLSRRSTASTALHIAMRTRNGNWVGYPAGEGCRPEYRRHAMATRR